MEAAELDGDLVRPLGCPSSSNIAVDAKTRDRRNIEGLLQGLAIPLSRTKSGLGLPILIIALDKEMREKRYLHKHQFPPAASGFPTTPISPLQKPQPYHR